MKSGTVASVPRPPKSSIADAPADLVGQRAEQRLHQHVQEQHRGMT